MQVFCPRCERRHDLDESAPYLSCDCGATLGPGRRQQLRHLRRSADDLCRMILTTGYPEAEIALARGRLRALAESLFPDRMDVYDMIYESRFERLWVQFRTAEGEAA